MGYTLPKKSKTHKQVEELIRRRREEEERQRMVQDEINLRAESGRRRQAEEDRRQAEEEQRRRMAQDQVDLMADAQRRQQESWMGGTVGQMEDVYGAKQEARQRRDEAGRATPVSTPSGLPLAEPQGIRQPSSPKAYNPPKIALAKQERSNQALIDRQLVEQADVLGSTTGRLVSKLDPEHIVPVPLPQVADPANVAKEGVVVTPEFSRALREDDSLAQELIDRHGEGVIVYEGKPSN